MRANLFFISLLLMIVATTSFPLIGIRDLSSEFVGVGLRDDVALPIEKRTVQKEKTSPFCSENREMYERYCEEFWTDRPSRLQNVLFQFCPGYENKCLH